VLMAKIRLFERECVDIETKDRQIQEILQSCKVRSKHIQTLKADKKDKTDMFTRPTSKSLGAA
jgi:hypothetical protein